MGFFSYFSCFQANLGQQLEERGDSASQLPLTLSNTDTSSVDLPDEIIELILSRCPVKSLVKFKSVSKSWQSIISNPRFSRIHHIQRSKLSENQNKFLIWARPRFYIGDLNLSRLAEDGNFIIESELDYPCDELIPLSSCDGLILLWSSGGKHMLWNPCIRKHVVIPDFNPKTHPEAFRIWSEPVSSPSMCHLYFDSMTDDYYIVFAYINCYTVYSCKNGIWGETKDIHSDVPPICRAFYDRCIYSRGNGEIVFFDIEDGKVHKFQQPDDVSGLIDVALGEISERLCFGGFSEDHRRLQLWVMEKNGSFEKSWRKIISMEKEQANILKLVPLCVTNEDLVVLGTRVSKNENEEDGDLKYFVYNPKKNSFQEIECDWKLELHRQYFPYSENLYMLSSNVC